MKQIFMSNIKSIGSIVQRSGDELVEVIYIFIILFPLIFRDTHESQVNDQNLNNVFFNLGANVRRSTT